MANQTVSGTLFKKMVTNGAVNLKNNHKEIDHLNVFPVPDGDTGTNMQMTMMAGIKEVSNLDSQSIVDISKILSRGLLIPGFYDAVQSPALAELAAWASLPFDEEEYRRREVGSPALTGEPGFSVLERTWARPTLEVHGIVGGFTAPGFKTVIPAKAHAKISCRLVPNQDPDTVLAQLRDAIARATPRGVVSRFDLFGASPASLVDPQHPILQAASAALADTFARPTVYMRSGGSIPVVALFQKELGIPSVLMGFGLPDDNLHAPNEKFHLPNLHKGIDAVQAFFTRLSESRISQSPHPE